MKNPATRSLEKHKATS